MLGLGIARFLPQRVTERLRRFSVLLLVAERETESFPRVEIPGLPAQCETEFSFRFGR